MKLTAKIKLLPTAEQKVLVDDTMKEYVRTVNAVLNDMIDYDQHYRFSSKMIDARLPSCLKAQAAGDAKTMDQKLFKGHSKKPVARKPCAVWNNQNFKIYADSIEFPVFINKSVRIRVRALIPAEVYELLQHSNLGSLRITLKNRKYIAQISYEAFAEVINTNSGVMGIDLGVKCPAVSVTDDGKVKFFGNGRRNQRIRRHFYAKRRKLQRKKKLNAVRKLDDKEQRILTDIDHKLSREIVNYAIEHGIKTIKLEALSGIRRKTRKSRKNTKCPASHRSKYRKTLAYKNRTVSNWSFYRLQQFIKYKAELANIEVIEINPRYTSQMCPNCGKLNKADDRTYSCKCGYHGHRDIVGARNILAA